MRLTIEEKGISEVVSKLNDLEKTQIPFAESRAVNALAYAIQRDTIERLLPSRFILRTDWWRPGRKTGVNYFPSNKKQFPNIFAIVNTLAPWMELQETGGIKRPKAGQAYVAIPTGNAQPNKREVIRGSRRAGALIGGGRGARRTLAHQGNPWVSTLRNAKPSIAVRLLDKFRLPIAVMYVGKDSVTIKPRFGFRENAKKIVDSKYLEVFNRELEAAIKTAK